MNKFLVFISFILLTTPAYANQDYSSRLCDSGNYKCIRIEKGETWTNLWPQPRERKLIMHFNRTNKKLRPGMLLALPPSSANNYMSFAPFEKNITATYQKMIVVNLKLLAWAAYDPEGNLVNWGPASGGKMQCADNEATCKTAVGVFEIYDVRGEDCVSSQYPINKGGAPMPYGMFFEKGFALHGSEELPGYNASHGCIRLFKSDAKWLNEEFVQTPGKTKVIILPYSS